MCRTVLGDCDSDIASCSGQRGQPTRCLRLHAAPERLFRPPACDDQQNVEMLNWGLSSFDSFPPTMLLIFQSLTMEGWTTIM